MALLQGVGQGVPAQHGQGDAVVLEQVVQRLGIAGEIGNVDALQLYFPPSPVAGVAGKAQLGPVHPVIQNEVAVEDYFPGIGRVASLSVFYHITTQGKVYDNSGTALSTG